MNNIVIKIMIKIVIKIVINIVIKIVIKMVINIVINTVITCVDPNSKFKMVPWSVANVKSLKRNSLSLRKIQPFNHYDDIYRMFV